MSRFSFALDMAKDPAPPLTLLVDGLKYAISEVEAEGSVPQTDTAVMLIGKLISFSIHSDQLDTGAFKRLVESCEASALRRISWRQ